MSTSIDPKIAAKSQPKTPFPVPRHAQKPSGGLRTSRDPRFTRAACVLLDLLFMFVNAGVVVGFRFVFNSGDPRQKLTEVLRDPNLSRQLGFLVIYVALLLLTMEGAGLYEVNRLTSFLRESRKVAKSILIATVLLTAIIYISGVTTVSRLVILFTSLLNFVTFVLWRLWYRGSVKRRVQQGVGLQNVVIVGTGYLSQTIARHLEENRHLGYMVKGFVDSNHHPTPGALGNIDDLSRIVRANFVDEVLITPPLEQEVISSVVWKARKARVNVKVVPDIAHGMRRIRWDYVGDYPAIEIHREPIPSLGLAVKRISDIFISSLILLLCAPLMLICAIAIRLDSRGPILYRSWRIGKKGKKFICYKLRTMVQQAEDLKEELQHLNERDGLLFKITNDPRVTRIGKFLRQYSIDEIPQFWNVFRGDMSLVGPRPPLVSEYDRYSLDHLRRLDVVPGITGLWQVRARHDPSFENYVALDVEYIENWTVWLDLKILLETIPVVLKGTGR